MGVATLIFLILAFLLPYLLWYYLVFIRRYPPGPFPLPFVGNSLQMPSDNPHMYMDRLSREYGHIYTLHLPTPHVVLTRYGDVRECLVAKGHEFATIGPQFDMVAEIANGGIMAANGESWKTQRRISQKILHDFSARKELIEERIMDSVRELIKHLDSRLALDDGTSEIDLFVPFQLCLGNVNNAILFGRVAETQKERERLLHYLDIPTHFFVDFMSRDTLLYNNWPWTKHIPFVSRAHKRATAMMNEYFSFIKAEVDAERVRFESESDHSGETPTTFVQAYRSEMMAKGSNPHLSVEQLYCVVSDLSVAGIEALVAALRWAILYLVEFPHIQECAHEEIDRELGDGEDVEFSEARPRMPYINGGSPLQHKHGEQRCLESVSASKQRIGCWEVPPNTDYLFHVYSDDASYDGAHYHPTEFRPERYLHRVDGVTKLKMEGPDRFPTFSMGKRQCPGESVARLELFLILTALLQRYEFRLAEGCTQVDLSYTYGLIIYPRNQPVRIVRRGRVS